MSVRRRAVIGLLAVASLVLTGCAGDGPDEDPGESQITLPPEESTPSSAETVLDLETMSDDELLAEAERAYQGFLDDVESMRANGSEDYSELDTWATGPFLERAQTVFVEDFPDGFALEGVQVIVGVSLVDSPLTDDGRVQAFVCLDNRPIRVFDTEGTDVTVTDGPDFSAGRTEFQLAPDATHLRIVQDFKLGDEDPDPCA